MLYAAQYVHNLVKFFLLHCSLKVSKLKSESQANIMCLYCENVQMSQTLWYSKKSQRTQIQGTVSLDGRICYYVGYLELSESRRMRALSGDITE